jgi:hypothetical protein
LRKILFWALGLTAVLSGAVVVARAAFGPFHLLVWVRSPLVGEGVAALAFTSLMLLRDGEPRAATGRPAIRSYALVLALTAAALGASLWFPLVCDEYVLATQGRAISWISAGRAFLQAGGDGFYRPLADLSLSVDALWAGLDPPGWHVLGLLLHLANTTLALLLVWRLFRRPAVACWAAALFGIHGARLEGMMFLARFDQLATGFVLGGLLLFDEYLESQRTPLLALSFAVMLAGLLSKESAFVFPLLALWLAVLHRRLDWRPPDWRVVRPILGYFALTAAVFLYRWSLLGGIGGYLDRATGRPAILNIRPLALLKALTLRLWGLLYFPVNWSLQPEIWLAATMAFALAALVWLALVSRPRRRELAFAAAFVLIAALPVAHLLLIGADLRGAAHLYLPSVGFCLFLALAIEGVGWRPELAGAAIVLFQVVALWHNMAVWDHTAHLAEQVCRMATEEAARSTTPPIFVNPPLILDGIGFYTNGLPECVAMHQPGARVSVVWSTVPPAPSPGTAVFVWNDEKRQFERTQ